MANLFQVILDRFRGDRETRFGYDVLNPNGRRKPISATIGREDGEVRGRKRDQLQANASDLARNLSLAAWMVRRHLDYVAMFRFRPMNKSRALNEALKGIMLEQSRPDNADAGGRFNSEKMFRLAETRRVLDGDTGLLKLDNLQMQGIQADLIKQPETAAGAVDPDATTAWINGVQINGQGRNLAYGLYQRKGYKGKEYSRTIQARNMMFYGFWNTYASDQTRGVSPMVSALAPLQDVYENFNFALAKAKVTQLLAVAFYRENAEPLGDLSRVYTGSGTDETDVAKPKDYKVNFGGGPKVFNMDPGDRAEFLESKNPSTEFQNFTELVIQVALKSLDIPYSFYDESHTNFFGSRAAWLHYDRSCMDKRDDQLELRRQYTVWQFQGAIRDGRLTLPAGMGIADLLWEWVPLGMPWWDPNKEVKGFESAIANGLDTPQRISRATGSEFYENVDAISEAIMYAESKGVELKFATMTGSTGQTAEPGTSDTSAAADGPDTEELKKRADAYGVAVRAGQLTPQPEDEVEYRTAASLPPLSPAAQEAWKIDGGVRRPVTLAPPTANTGTDDPDQPPNLDPPRDQAAEEEAIEEAEEEATEEAEEEATEEAEESNQDQEDTSP